MALGVELHLDDIKLALGFIVLLTEAVDLVLLRVELDPVPAFDVLLNLHSHDVGVDWQSHFVGHGVDLPLLLLYSSAHVIKTFLNGEFKLFFGLNLLREPFLKLV